MDMWAYRLVLVLAFRGFAASPVADEYTWYMPSFRPDAVSPEGPALRNEFWRAVAATCHAVAGPPSVAQKMAARARYAFVSFANPAGVEKLVAVELKPECSVNGNDVPPAARRVSAAFSSPMM